MANQTRTEALAGLKDTLTSLDLHDLIRSVSTEISKEQVEADEGRTIGYYLERLKTLRERLRATYKALDDAETNAQIEEENERLRMAAQARAIFAKAREARRAVQGKIVMPTTDEEG